jgi:LPXTG-site transpeptidase (sortase) family protein
MKQTGQANLTMEHSTRHSIKVSPRRDWRLLFGNFLMIAGLVFLTSVALARIKIFLAADLQTKRTFLIANSTPTLVLPTMPVTIPEKISAVEAPVQKIENPLITEPMPPYPPVNFETNPSDSQNLSTDNNDNYQIETRGNPSIAYLPLILAQNIEDEQQPPADSEGSLNGQNPRIGSGPIVRLVIPSLNIDRAVIEVGLKKTNGNQLTWNTDMLFSTNNRSDLVGQASTSVNPGDGGNIILIGHNYNNGWYSPEGVFVNIHQLKQGSKILVYTRDGGEYQYEVKLVKQVPWREQNGNELEKHHKYLWPTENEQLTLVTCGGANFGIWSARVYVVAIPKNP